MKPVLIHVDAFTHQPFSGNPAAVCLLERAAPAQWMQAVAQEINLSETAFLWPHEDKQHADYHLCWFTPVAQVELCGHATLASAHVVYESGLKPTDQALRFDSLSGVLGATLQTGRIALDFPARTAQARSTAADVLQALGVETADCLDCGVDRLVVLNNAAQLRALQPDFARLKTLKPRGVIVTAAGDEPGIDFISRFFAPRVGIDEDPVTGAAHCCLAPYWAERLGKTTLCAFQASARGGFIDLRLNGDRVTLIGDAVSVMRGQWLLPPT